MWIFDVFWKIVSIPIFLYIYFMSDVITFHWMNQTLHEMDCIFSNSAASIFVFFCLLFSEEKVIKRKIMRSQFTNI